MRGIIIAGTHSGCGKTTLTLALLAALKKKGLKLQTFKCGPDHIDPGLHKLITGKPSRNLDVWMCGEEYVKSAFYRCSMGVDMVVVEGVMGMYDGEFNTAYLAALLDLPLILVVDAYGMAESAGALIEGFFNYRPGIKLAGVIFNRVASENHFIRLKSGVHNVSVLGYLPRDANFEIPHRHLGLCVAEEDPISYEQLDTLADACLKHIDVDRLIQDEKYSLKNTPVYQAAINPGLLSTPVARIAVARDKAFCFYYHDNLYLLQEAGAELVFFSPLSDAAIPGAVNAIYIGGGYPELYAERLSANVLMRSAINKWANAGGPIYAECGGLMYLSAGIYDTYGKYFEMAGVFPFKTKMRNSKVSLGYREIELKADCMLGRRRERLRGHEFHYSEINSAEINLSDGSTKHAGVYSVKDNNAREFPSEGYTFKNVLASYIHIHFGSQKNIAENIVKFVNQSNSG